MYNFICTVTHDADASTTSSTTSKTDEEGDTTSLTCVQSQSPSAHSPRGQPHSSENGTLVIANVLKTWCSVTPNSASNTTFYVYTADDTTSTDSVTDEQRDTTSVTCVQPQSPTAHHPSEQPHASEIGIYIQT